MDKTFISWLLTLGIGFPFLSILLGELAEQLKRQQHPLANAIRKLKQYVLPPLAVLLVMRELLAIAKTEDSVRIVESITWVTIILVGIAFINAILTTKKPEKQFQVQVPNLFFQVARALVILGIGYYLISGIWGVDISSLTTALGVGSLAVGLALQDTLSNLVSGFLLLFSKPFKIGDWIEFDGSGGHVIDQNWWAVTLDSGFVKIIVPNAALSKVAINNEGSKARLEKISVSLSYDDSPNKVIPALHSLTDGVSEIKPGSGYAVISSYGDYAINYDLWYLTVPGLNGLVAGSTLLAKFYYLVKREGFTIAYPQAVRYEVPVHNQFPGAVPQIMKNRQSEMFAYLRSLSYFFNLDDTQIEQLASTSQFKVYGSGELITKEGLPDAGLYAIYKGRVQSLVTDHQGSIRTDKQFGVGDVFGQMALYPGEVSPITAIADNDVELAVIPAEVIVNLIQINPKFASEIIQFIEERKKAIRLVKSITGSMTSVNGNNYQVLTRNTVYPKWLDKKY